MFEQEAARFCSLIKLLTALQSICTWMWQGARKYWDVEVSTAACFFIIIIIFNLACISPLALFFKLKVISVL